MTTEKSAWADTLIHLIALASRTETLLEQESLPLSDWWRAGKHEEFGTVTLRQQVSYFAAHESTHLSQIKALTG